MPPVLEPTLLRPQVMTPHTPVQPPHAAAYVPNTRANEVAGKSVVVANDALKAQQLTKEQKDAAKLQGVKSAFMMPANMEFFGMIGGGLLGMLTKKLNWSRATAVLGMTLQAPIHALRKTTLADSLKLPGNVFKEASIEAAQAGGKAAGWARAADRQSTKLLKTAKGLEQNIADAVQPHWKNAATQLDSFEQNGTGKRLHGLLDKIVKHRETAVSNAYKGAIDKAHTALHTEGVGFFKGIGNFFTRTKPGSFQPGSLKDGPFEEIANDFAKAHIFPIKAEQAANALEGVKTRAQHLTGVMESLEKLMKGDALKGEAKARAGAFAKHLQKAVSNAHALETYTHASGQGLSTMASALVKAVGRVPMFNALLAVGITAGVGAVLVTGRGEGKEARAAFKKVNAELTNQTESNFLKAIKSAQSKGTKWAVAKTGLRLGGEVADGLMWLNPTSAGAGMMGAAMLPTLCESLVPTNKMLGALEALDKADHHEIDLQPSDRILLLAQLIGGIDSVAAHGGEYNMLAKRMAADIQERGLDYKQIVQLLGNNDSFAKFSAEMAAKQKVEADKVQTHSKATTANDNAPLIANDHSMTPGATAAMMHAAPTTRIGVGAAELQHKGMVAGAHQVAMA